MDHLDIGPIGKARGAKIRFLHQLTIYLDHDQWEYEVHSFKELADGLTLHELYLISIDCYGHIIRIYGFEP